MMITKEQRKALKRIFDRDPLYDLMSYKPDKMTVWCNRRWNEEAANMGYKPKTYRQFRKTAMPTFGCDGAIVAPWCGMFLCIERDGYTHS
jgi:hypothetical protein